MLHICIATVVRVKQRSEGVPLENEHYDL